MVTGINSEDRLVQATFAAHPYKHVWHLAPARIRSGCRRL